MFLRLFSFWEHPEGIFWYEIGLDKERILKFQNNSLYFTIDHYIFIFFAHRNV